MLSFTQIEEETALEQPEAKGEEKMQEDSGRTIIEGKKL